MSGVVTSLTISMLGIRFERVNTHFPWRPDTMSHFHIVYIGIRICFKIGVQVEQPCTITSKYMLFGVIYASGVSHIAVHHAHNKLHG